MNAPLPSTGSLKALAQARLEQTSGAHLCRTSARTFAPETAHLCSENEGQTCADESALLARCRDACRNLSLWPEELAANLTEEDKAIILSGDPAELGVLRCMAEGLSQRLRTGTLPPHLHEAYARLRKELAEHPSLRFACETLTPNDDPVLLACAIRGKGFVTLRIARERYQDHEFELIELTNRWNTKEEPA